MVLMCSDGVVVEVWDVKCEGWDVRVSPCACCRLTEIYYNTMATCTPNLSHPHPHADASLPF